MKKIILFLTLSATLTFADLSVDQIRKMVMKIHEKRDGVQLETLESTKEPFVHIKVEDNTTTYEAPAKQEVVLSLHAIMNDKAYINDAWYKVNDVVLGYILKYIGNRGVVLRNDSHIKKLFLHENKENYISIEEKE